MAAIGTAGAQDLIDQAAAKGYSADDVKQAADRIDRRAAQRANAEIGIKALSRQSARVLQGEISRWPDRTAAAQAAETAEPMATDRQVDFLADLYRRFAAEPTDEQLRHWASLTRRQASTLIDEFKTTAG